MARFTLSRRAALLGGAAALAAPAVRAQAPELTTLRSSAKSWLWAAEDYASSAGLFTRAGVRVSSNASNRGTNVAALQGGGVDIVLGDPGEVIRARTQNLQIRTFVATVNKYASHVVLKRDILQRAGVTDQSTPEQKVAALRGLRLGTTGPGAAPDALFRYLASLGGLNPERDMQLVTLQAGPAMVAAVQQNQIDGFCLSSPTADLAVQRQNCGYLFQMVLSPPPALAEYMYIIASSGEDTIRTKRAALVAYVRGIALALREIAAEPDKFKTWARGWFEGMDPEIFESAFANNSRIYFADPKPREDLFRKNIEFINTVNRMMNAEPVPPSVSFATMFETTIAEEAVRGL